VAASRWVTQLPAGEPRQWALRNLATSWMPYEPTAAEAWLKKLPAADQTDVRQFLESNGNGNR
jgi:predicted phosphoadenosine phosphosulfate sulfurtransferase